jgi:hypothetical protein
MYRVPDVYSAEYLRDYPTQFAHEGRWFASRPIGRETLSIRERFRVTWRVFKGEMDAVMWMEPKGRCSANGFKPGD